MNTESNQHSMANDVAFLREMIRSSRPHSGSEEAHDAWDDAIDRAYVILDNLVEQLEAAQKAQHVQNLEWAISLAESDPLYAEVFRPYFQKIVDALASYPARELAPSAPRDNETGGSLVETPDPASRSSDA